MRFEVFPLKLRDEISKIDVTFTFYLSLTFMRESGSEPPISPLPLTTLIYQLSGLSRKYPCQDALKARRF